MTSQKSSMTGEELLEHPFLWSEFQKRLSLGLDPYHDRDIIYSFAEMIDLPVSRVVSKLQTFRLPGNRTIN
jgi:hypothetical protein